VAFVSAGVVSSGNNEEMEMETTAEASQPVVDLDDHMAEASTSLPNVSETTAEARSALITMGGMTQSDGLTSVMETTSALITSSNPEAPPKNDRNYHAASASSVPLQPSTPRFYIDTQGQQPFFTTRSAPAIRSPSPTASEASSSEEEIVFRGRIAARQVVDDPVSELVGYPTSSPAATTTPFWDNGSTPWAHRSKPGVGWSVPRAAPRLKPQTSHTLLYSETLTADRPHPNAVGSTRTAKGDPSSLSKAATDEDEDEDQSENDEDAIYQDYVDNLRAQGSDADIDSSTFQARELDVTQLTTLDRVHHQPSSTSSSEDEAGNRVQKGQRGNTKQAEDPADSDDEEDKDSDDQTEEDDDDDSIADDMDLIERKMARLDDENIARLLAKQDELGILADDLVLFDEDTALDSVVVKEALVYSKKSPKSARHVKKTLRASSLMVDLEHNPYGEFDIMDFERPSLSRKKGKGKRGEPTFEGVDSDLEAALKVAWNKDRETKKARKEERERLRSEGLLGKKNSRQADLDDKYSEGLSMEQVKQEFVTFLASSRERLAFPPMGKDHRKMIHELSAVFGCNTKSTGQGRSRYTTLVKTRRTIPFHEQMFQARARQISQGYFPRLDKSARKGTKGSQRGGGGGGNSSGVRYQDGDVVGASAAEISSENKGRIMLEKMGWTSGTGLGTDRAGIQAPIQHIVKNTKAGLG
jgi:hypothetical protein